VVAVSAFLGASLLAFCVTTDDPFITLRYAANVVDGLGPVFNEGERVEGFTSPLHLVVAIAGVLLPGGADLLKLKLASIVFGVLLVHRVCRIFEKLPLHPVAKLLGPLLVAASWMTAVTGVNALETTLAAWLIALLIDRLLDPPVDGPSLQDGVVAGLAILARPEAALVVGALALTSMAVESGRIASRLRWVLPAAAIAILSVLARLAYYHELVPNTYFAKSGPPSREIWGAWRYLVRSLQPDATLPSTEFQVTLPDVFLVAQVACLAAGVAVAARRRDRLLYCAAAVLAQCLFVLRSGGDWMPGGRFVLPVLAPAAVLSVTGVMALGRLLPRPSRALAHLGVAGLVVAGAYPLAQEGQPIWKASGRFNNYDLVRTGWVKDFSTLWADLPQVVRCARPGELVALSEVGYVGYARRDVRILDTRGLTSAAVAKGATPDQRGTTGIVDPNWWSLDSAAGREIAKRDPVLVATLETTNTPDSPYGRYERTAENRYLSLVLTSFARIGSSCDPLARADPAQG
jgi:hypothetical protein